MKIWMFSAGLILGAVIGACAVYFVYSGKTDALGKIAETNERMRIASEKRAQELQAGAALADDRIKELSAKLAAAEAAAASRENDIAALAKETDKTGKSGAASEPKNPPSVSESGEADASKKANGKEKSAGLDDLIAKIEANPGDRKLVAEFVNLAATLTDEKALKEAVDRISKIMKEALAKDPDNPDLFFNMGNSSRAEMAWLQIKMKENPMVFGPMMQDLAVGAIGWFTKAIEKNSGDDEALLTRAYWNHYTPGKLADAEKDFSELVKRARERSFEEEAGAEIYLGMAMTLEKAGKRDEAKKYIEEGLGQFPQNKALTSTLENLNK